MVVNPREVLGAVVRWSGVAASLAPPTVVDQHLLRSVVVDGTGGGRWTLLLDGGWLRWVLVWIGRAFLGLQLMFGRGGGCVD
jgi:hypothetical protein